jgi:hypothetical protein
MVYKLHDKTNCFLLLFWILPPFQLKFSFLAKFLFPPKVWFSFPPLQFPAKILSQAPPTKSREGEEGGGDRIPQPIPEDAGRESKEARGGQLIPINIPGTFNNRTVVKVLPCFSFHLRQAVKYNLYYPFQAMWNNPHFPFYFAKSKLLRRHRKHFRCVERYIPSIPIHNFYSKCVNYFKPWNSPTALTYLLGTVACLQILSKKFAGTLRRSFLLNHIVYFFNFTNFVSDGERQVAWSGWREERNGSRTLSFQLRPPRSS